MTQQRLVRKHWMVVGTRSLHLPYKKVVSIDVVTAKQVHTKLGELVTIRIQLLTTISGGHFYRVVASHKGRGLGAQRNRTLRAARRTANKMIAKARTVSVIQNLQTPLQPTPPTPPIRPATQPSMRGVAR